MSAILLDVWPSATIPDSGDRGGCDSQSFRNILEHYFFPVGRSDLFYIVLCQFRLRMLRAVILGWITLCSMALGISLIRMARIPSQVFEPIVFWVTIVVATLHSKWTWTNKRKHHQMMNSGDLFPALNVRNHMKVVDPIANLMSRWLKNDFSFSVVPGIPAHDSCKRLYATLVASLVAGESRDITPFFHGPILTNRG